MMYTRILCENETYCFLSSIQNYNYSSCFLKNDKHVAKKQRKQGDSTSLSFKSVSEK